MSKSLDFLKDAPAGSVVLVTQKSWIHDLVCAGQAGVTPDGKPSHWAHVFIVGRPREDGRVRIYESDIYLSRGGLKNGAQENTLAKYGSDGKNRRLCQLDYQLSEAEVDAVIAAAQQKIAAGIQYAVLELFGTLWAFLSRTFRQPNPLDIEKASYCSSFVNDCFAGVEPLVPAAVADPTNVSPEHIYQSEVRNPLRRELVF